MSILWGNTTAPTPSASSSVDLEDVINAMFSTFSIIALGYSMGRAKFIPTSVGEGLGTFLFQVSLPCLIFHSVGTMSFTGVNWWVLIALLISKGVVFIVVLGLGSYWFNLASGAVWAIFCTQSNDFALGLPLLKALYKTTNPFFPQYIYLCAPISLCLLNPIGFVCMELGNKNDHLNSPIDVGNSSLHNRTPLRLVVDAILGTLRNPLVLAVLLGLVFNVIFDGSMTRLVEQPIVLLGQAFDGVALFCLGLSVVGKFEAVNARDTVLPISMVFVKCLLLPVVCKVVVDAMPDDITEGPLSGESDLAFLLGMFPTAPGVFLYARRYGMPEESIAFATAAGTFASAPIILIAAIFIYIIKDTVTSDAPWDWLQLQLKLYVGFASICAVALLILPLVFTLALQKIRNRWKMMSTYDFTNFMLVLLACIGQIASPLALLTCSQHSKAENVLQWIFVFGGVILYRLSTMGLGLGMLVCAMDGSGRNTRYYRALPFLVIVLTALSCVLLPFLSGPQAGDSPADICERPYQATQLWVASVVNALNAIVCTVAVLKGNGPGASRSSNEPSATLLLRSTENHFAISNFDFHETTDFYKFLNSQAPFFFFQAVSASLNCGVSFISMYTLDRQSGLVRLMVIIDGIITYGGGIIVAWCWNQLGTGKLWAVFGNWVRQKRSSSRYDSISFGSATKEL